MPKTVTSRRHTVSLKSAQIRFAEFFAGIGLVRMGLERLGWSCAWANDLDPGKRFMYAYHFGCQPDEIDESDVHDLSGNSVPDVQIATASFPCTDLSLAGGRAGIHNGESSAFWGFHRVLDEMGASHRPPVVLLENVVGLLNSRCGHDLRDVLCSMNNLGYRVDPFIVDARWFVPQSRPRLFVVCLSDEIGFHGGTHVSESRIRPSKLMSFIDEHADDIAWCIRDLPDPPRESKLRLKNIVSNPRRKDCEWWSRERVEYLYNQMFPRHQAWIDARLESDRCDYATVFRRVRPQQDGSKRSMAELRTDGIAGCLRTPKGGSGRQILVRAGRGLLQARLLTGQECARLMGADEFRIGVTLNQALFGFGDAVCVDVVEWIAIHYLRPVLQAAGLALR